MSGSAWIRVGLAMTALAIAFGLGALWWWAFFGLSAAIGTATGWTVFTLVVGGLVLAAAAAWDGTP